MKPYSEEWDKLANSLARTFAPYIYPCKKCNHPVASGFQCTFCGDTNPSSTKEQDEAFEQLCKERSK